MVQRKQMFKNTQLPLPETKDSILDTQLILENLMFHLPGHVYWKDSHGVYRGCNNRQAQSLGLSCGEEVIGKTDFDLPWQDELASHFWENDRQVLVTGMSKSVEELAIVDGKEAIVWSLKVPLKTHDNAMIGILGISIDITEQKRAEEKLIQSKKALEAAYAAKTSFLENMRHDIRTPLAGMRGCTEAIQGYLNKPKLEIDKIREYLDDLDASSAELLVLLNSVISSMQSMQSASLIKKERFDLAAQLRSLLKLNQARARQKGLRLQLNHDDAIPLLIGDGERIGRIVLELITNALNFTDNGTVTLTTQLAKKEGERVIIKISVEDTGKGIPIEKQSAMFTRFPPLYPAYQGAARGTGLGLSFVKQAIDELEGELYLESTPDKGSIFTCVLPLKAALLRDENDKWIYPNQSNHQNAQDNTTPSHPSKQRTLPIRVLLVEDDRIVGKIMLLLLTRLNCQVDVAENLHTALLQAKEVHYELIFLDIGLPDGSGNELAAKIRQDSTSYNQLTPIIAVTAHVDDDSKEVCQRAGINLVLSKPLLESAAREVLALFVGR